MADLIKLSPDSFRTLYLRKEDNVILRTERGRRIIINKILPEEWQSYRLYDYELALNENKRTIRLIDKKYLPQIEKELREKIAE
jgi:hypothetical protein